MFFPSRTFYIYLLWALLLTFNCTTSLNRVKPSIFLTFTASVVVTRYVICFMTGPQSLLKRAFRPSSQTSTARARINVTLKRFPHKDFCCGKTRMFTYSEFVSVALVIQHAVRHIISSMACLALPLFFPTFFHKRRGLYITKCKMQNILQNYKIFKTLKLSYLQYSSLKSLCCYNSQSVSQCAGRIYSLYVDVTVVLAGMYWCNWAKYWLQAVWGWQDSVETCSGVIICEIIVRI